MDKSIKNCKKQYAENLKLLEGINTSIEKEQDDEKKKELEIKYQEMSDEIDYFVCNIYAKAVFDIYNIKKPLLVRRLTKEVVAWDNAFGNDFDKIPPSLKESLVGLIEGSGRYKFK